MITAQEVLEKFCLLAGLEPEQSQQWLPLCQLGIDELARMTDFPSNPSDAVKNKLLFACAGCTLLRYALLAQAGTGQDFKTPELSMSTTAYPVSAARELRRDLLQAAADCLGFGPCVFKRTVG